MSRSANASFYDIQPLVLYLESGVPIITPNFRLARRIRLAWGRYLQQQGITTWPTPQVVSLEQWWRDCLARSSLHSGVYTQLATEQQELELWERCIRRHPDSAGLLRPRGAAGQARNAYHNLLLWQVDWHAAALRSQFSTSPDCSIFLQWAESFERELTASGLSLLPGEIRKAADSCPVPQLVLAEFDELAPLHLQALESQASHLAWQRQRGEPAICRLQACDDAEQELYTAARWARECLHSEHATSVAILLPDLAQQRRRFERILREVFEVSFDAALPVNFSAGVSLATTPPVRTALGLLALLLDRVQVEPLVGLLHSPYRPRAESQAEQVLIQRLYRWGRIDISTRRLRNFCAAIESAPGRPLALGQQLLQLSQQRSLRRMHKPSAWIALFSDCLEAFQWPSGRALDSVEFQQVEHWYDCLERLAELDAVCPEIDLNEALRRLHLLCDSAVFQAQSPDAPVQVLGLLEAAGLHFERLWLCGMAAGQWPARPSPNPFLPVPLQRKLGMPHADAAREHRYAAQLLEHYQHSCDQLVASYVQQEDTVPRQPGTLVADFEPCPAIEWPLCPPAWQRVRDQFFLQRAADDLAPAINPEELEGMRGGSGLLQDQSNCPFRAFSHHRLQARALGDLGVTLTAAQRGSLLHDAMFRLWRELGGHAGLLELDSGEQQVLIDTSIEGTFTDFVQANREVAGEAYLRLEQTRLARLFSEWLAIERQRMPFEVSALEKEYELQLAGLRLQLRVDRIDRLPNGDLVVIDYKSGRAEVRYWLGERPEEPQLPLYLEALETPVAGLGFAVVKEDGCAIKGIGDTTWAPSVITDLSKASRSPDPTLENWQTLRAHWQSTLQQLATDFLTGRAAVDPLDVRQSCTWCGLQPLCRIGEKRLAGDV